MTPEHQTSTHQTKIEELEALLGGLADRLRSLEANGGSVEGVAPLLDRCRQLEERLNVAQQELSEQSRTAAEIENQRNECELRALRAEAACAALRSSLSWRLTAPLRATLDGLQRLYQPPPSLRSIVSAPAWLWHRAPLSDAKKRGIERHVFRRFPSLEVLVSRYSRWRLQGSRGSTPFTSAPPQTWHLPEATSRALDLHSAEIGESTLSGRVPPDHSTTLVAFYLPQFHAIPENDEWWGQGFTEWTNVAPAKPQFEGHYQPHVPGELGYYDLLDGKTQAKQVKLAKSYGVGAFCFYFYWFGGKRLLEEPIKRYLADSSLDLPFCLCWANENWSRRWDGLDQEILIAQNHSIEDDIAFIAHVSQYMRDPRYLRVRGQPILLVYRPALLPEPRETVDRWRQWCRENGVGEIYLAYTQSFEATDPAHYGFDASVEFPPNNTAPPVVTHQITTRSEQFDGVIYDWSTFPLRSEHYVDPGYRLFRGVCPGWDNTARRKSKGAIFVGNTPSGYAKWLANAVVDTCKRFHDASERLVFVNAWNEWAEGAHLEPDARDGLAYLEATRNVLCRPQIIEDDEATPKLLLVTHDCHPHGAQYLSLSIARRLSERMRVPLHVMALAGGMLKEDFNRLPHFRLLEEGASDSLEILRQAAREMVDLGVRTVLLNTTVSGLMAAVFKELGVQVTCLVHELPGIIRSMDLLSHAESIAQNADAVIFGAKAVQDGFLSVVTTPPRKQIVRGQGLYVKSRYRGRVSQEEPRASLRRRFGLHDEARIVLGVGYGDHRKGLDLFLEASSAARARGQEAHFVWVGHYDEGLYSRTIQKLLDNGRPDPTVRMEGLQRDVAEYYAGSDVYLLTSREDPFPSVVLESLSVGVPVVALPNSGGGADLVKEGYGTLTATDNPEAIAESVIRLLSDNQLRQRLGRNGMDRIFRDFSFDRYVSDLIEICGVARPRVSVIIPNYNYGHLLRDRLSSIAGQTLLPYEVIILDDASADNSIEVLESVRAEFDLDIQIVTSSSNSGSVFRQWHRGVSLARGDLVWIAEADDLSEPTFLQIVSWELVRNSRLVMAYCQSRQIDEHGQALASDYRYYTDQAEQGRWDADYTRTGTDEVSMALATLNCVPNVSAAVFRRAPIHRVLTDHLEELAGARVAGDWLAYLRLLQFGDIAFKSASLNIHRRHQSSVTQTHNLAAHLEEILQAQELARSLYTLDSTAVVKQRDYAAKVACDFQLTLESVSAQGTLFPRVTQLLGQRQAG